MYKNFKIISTSLAIGVGLFCIPSITMAAFNDAVLTTDTVINVAGINLNVSGQTGVVETIVVGPASFSFTLQPGSLLQVTSPDKRILATDAGAQYIGNNICTTEQSVLAHYSNAGSPTITITPSVTTCSTPPSISGGGYPNPVATTTPITNTVKATTTPPITNFPKVSPYVRILTVGSEGTDVIALQSFLKTKGFLAAQIDISKGYFGLATKKALIEYQRSAGVSPIGIFGPATRAKIEAEIGFKAATIAITYSRNLNLGSKGNDVRALQEFLISRNTGAQAEILRKNGVSSFFGKLTKAGLAEYQSSVGISPAGGYFGPVTRSYIMNLSQ